MRLDTGYARFAGIGIGKRAGAGRGAGRPAGAGLAVLGLLAGLALPAGADIRVSYFSNHMVLQRSLKAPVWGKADVGEDVTVRFNGQTRTAKADGSGNWKVVLDSMPAGGPFSMELSGKNTVTLTNVMVGDVWLCSGQSNMEFTVSGVAAYTQDSVNAANFPNIRHINTHGTSWQVCSPSTVKGFTAVGYFMARDLQKNQNVAIGLIHGSVGGTAVEKWMPAGYPGATSELYNQWIAPVAGWGLRGAIWYQGESNTGNAPEYQTRFSDMIRGWRKAWNQGDFPFLWVQLANYMAVQTDANENGGWPQVREAQRLSMALPNTGMAVIIDIGEGGDIHPKNKIDVGRRLALAARAKAYGQTLVHSGPMYESMKAEGSKLRLRFAHTGGGLMAKGGGALKGFVIAGADNKFQFANAAIEGKEVVLSHAAVTAPTQARYAWANNPVCNLYNAEGLPASPFKTSGPQLPVILADRGPRSGDFGPRSGDSGPRGGDMAWSGHPALALRLDALGRERGAGTGAPRLVLLPSLP